MSRNCLINVIHKFAAVDFPVQVNARASNEKEPGLIAVVCVSLSPRYGIFNE